ncbi:MAG: NADH-quinone oxidoreductase subunit N [Bdellovibrionales bacterium]|nr:NADH-quinone oxidoreductase subunit N [Bdellovibrionales bacterium]
MSLPILPWLVLSIGLLATILISVVRVGTKRPAQIFALLTLLATFFYSVTTVPSGVENVFNGAFEVSALTQVGLALFSLIGCIFVLGTSRYLTKEGIHISDYYHLMLLMILGAAVMIGSKDLISIFIALEVMSLPAYTLAGFRRHDARSNEAGIKYFVMGGAIGAVFLLGAAFIFGATGSVSIDKIFEWSKVAQGDFTLFYIGHLLVLIAFLFKVAAVPFHFWKPDVYEGSPIAVTGMMATVISAASFIVISRLIGIVDFGRIEWGAYAAQLKQVVRVIVVMSLVVGSAVLLTQSNLKRMLAYSSISHTGYLLLGILSSISHPQEIFSVWMYLFGYCLMTSGLFVLLSQSEPKADMGVELIDLTGLMKRSPYTTCLWIVFLFSMAGIPFTVGFFSKYFVFLSSVSAGETAFVVIAAVCAVVSAYAYIRPVALMVMRDADPSASNWKGSPVSTVVATVSALAVIYFGVLPGTIVQFLKGVPIGH